MNSLFGIIAAAFLWGFAAETRAKRLDELFASWQKVQREVRSLVIEFTLEKHDTSFKTRDEHSGSFRLLNTANGDVAASYDLIRNRQRFGGLLSLGRLYTLDYSKKTAMGFDAANDNPQRIPRSTSIHF
jgi:hypothetical protein